MSYKYIISVLAVTASLVVSGCGPAVIGGAAYGGYKSGMDKRSIGTMMDDSVISTKVKTEMIKNESVKARHIDVDVLNGIVYLIGVVESSSQKKTAADIAKKVKGVQSVENQLLVGRTNISQVVKDAFVTSKIRTELLKAPDIRSTRIDVDTNNNIITLGGVVGSVKEKNRVLAVVKTAAKGRQVNDNLTIGD